MRHRFIPSLDWIQQEIELRLDHQQDLGGASALLARSWFGDPDPAARLAFACAVVRFGPDPDDILDGVLLAVETAH